MVQPDAVAETLLGRDSPRLSLLHSPLFST